MPRAVAVFVVEQHDEIRDARKVVEGTFDQLLDRLFRRQALKIELALLGADFLIDPLKHRQIERVLVSRPQRPEHQIDHMFPAGALGGRARAESVPKIADSVGVFEKKK